MKHFFFDLEVAEDLIVGSINEELAKLKLNSQKLLILIDLDDQEKKGNDSDSVTIPLVAERLKVDVEMIEPYCEELETDQWIVAIEDPIDRRFKKLFLTNKSRSIIDYLTDLYDYSYKKMFKGISNDEQEVFVRVLGTIIENLR